MYVLTFVKNLTTLHRSLKKTLIMTIQMDCGNIDKFLNTAELTILSVQCQWVSASMFHVFPVFEA